MYQHSHPCRMHPSLVPPCGSPTKANGLRPCCTSQSTFRRTLLDVFFQVAEAVSTLRGGSSQSSVVVTSNLRRAIATGLISLWERLRGGEERYLVHSALQVSAAAATSPPTGRCRPTCSAVRSNSVLNRDLGVFFSLLACTRCDGGGSLRVEFLLGPIDFFSRFTHT